MRIRVLPAALACLVLASCGTPGPPTSSTPPGHRHDRAGQAPAHDHAAAPTPRPTPAPGTVAPRWLGTRVLPRTPAGYGEIRRTPKALRVRRFTLPDSAPMLPGRGFGSVVERAPREVLERSTWRPGCPVRAADLDWIRLTFWGFDHRRHTGELLVNHSATKPLVRVFRRLYDLRFPIEEMRITTKAELDAPPTGDGNDTGAFVCRPTVGATSFSQHAYGLAVDINPFQNPYHNGDLVLPELASSYLDRAWRRPGMIRPDGPVVRAFAAVGWTWGGTWHSLRDLQHFSANGR